MSDEPSWYERAFGNDYLFLYRHRSAEQGREQVAAMLRGGLLSPQGRVLDLCCGSGRHLKAMREAGLEAWGLDLSAELLRTGGLAGLAARADSRRVPYRTGAFDVVVNLFSSFGYFDSDAAHLTVLGEIRRVLKPGGRLVLDHMNAEVTIRELAPESVETRDGASIRQRRRYDKDNRRVIKEITLTREGRTRQWHESVRLFTPAELDTLLAKAGLTPTARYGDLDGRAFEPGVSARQVVVAERP